MPSALWLTSSVPREIDPNAKVQHGLMKEGVWTYVGRAYYAGGDYPAARKALEQARTRYPEDSLAPLYLGLALSQDGDRQRGLKEIQTGLSGLGGWFEYMEYYSLYGVYWDPGRIIRSRIEKDLATTQGKEINWTDLIASVELVGMEVEREADAVREQLRRDRRDWVDVFVGLDVDNFPCLCDNPYGFLLREAVKQSADTVHNES